MSELPGETGSPTAQADPPGLVKRNYLLGILNGALVRVGLGFIDPHLILAAFVYEQTQSSLLVGLLAALSAAGIFWPQLYMSRLIEHRSRKKPFYVVMSAVRIAALSAMIGSMWLAGTHESGWTLALFFCAYFVFRSAQGCGAIPFLDIVGQTIVPTRLGRFFAWRALFGDTLAVLAGFLVVQRILAEVRSPTNYVLLAAGGLLLLGSGWLSFSFTREEKNDTPPKERGLRQMLVEAARLLKHNANYRGLLCIRALVCFNTLAIAFYVPYGVERLGAVGISGLLLTFISASRVVSSLFWGRISDAKGNRLCLIGAGVFYTLSPAAALIAPRLPLVFSVSLPYTSVPLDLPLCVYLLALCFFGLAVQANGVGINAFLIESAPPGRRPSYIAFLNTVTSPLTFVPALAGALVAWGILELDALFALVTLTGLLTLLAATRLTEVRKPAPANRPKRKDDQQWQAADSKSRDAR